MTWNPAEVGEIQTRLAVNKSRRWARRAFPRSPKGATDEGLQDFRRFPLENLATLDVQSVDFSGSRSPKNQYGVDTLIQVTSCRCRNVRFDGASRFHALNGVFEDCSFDRIATDGCSFTGIYRRCTFRRANLRKAFLLGEFYDCEFIGADLRVDCWTASFSECRFEECKVHRLFLEIDDFIHSKARVTFTVDSKGRPKPGEHVRSSNVGHLERLPWAVE